MRYANLLLFALMMVAGNARADGDALCRSFVTIPDYFSHPKAITYVKTGVVEEGFKPEFSREYYAAILGRSDDLAKLLSARDKSKPLDGRILDDTVSAGEVQSLKLLLATGISPDHTAAGQATPIMYAIKCNEALMLSYLLAAGADVYWHSPTYGDAMISAVVLDSRESVRLLLLAGYDPACASYLGPPNTIERIANHLGDADMVMLLSSFREIRTHSRSTKPCKLPPQDRTPLREPDFKSPDGGQATSHG